MTRRTLGTVIALLLLLSVFSGIYLVINQKVDNTPLGVSVLPQRYIGVVDICGQIYAPSSIKDFILKESHESIIKTLKEFRRDSRVRGVIVRINSPGGTVGATQEINAEIARLQEAGKPVVASIADMGASGGYYVAASCDKIVANPGSMLGSIGVIMTTSDMSELLKKVGINMGIFKSGEFKDTGSFHRSVTEREEELLQEIVDNAYKQFVEHVSVGRDIPLEDVIKLAQGQIFTGEQAFGNNLVDYLGDFERAHRVAEDLAGLKNTQILRTQYGKWGRWMDMAGSAGLPDLSALKGFEGIAYLYKP
ncbi:MAG: signal peptide peptidase SppA [Elusimicrobia bacterium]|nr:signal peptide peptidase SppA [Elusimicrobiota bacterium]